MALQTQAIIELLKKAANANRYDVLRRGNVVNLPYPSLGGEDFSYYLLKVPGCFVRFGAAKDGHEKIASHSPKFDFDEDVLRVGAAYLSELVRYSLKKLRKK